jgi:hypothetical protein
VGDRRLPTLFNSTSYEGEIDFAVPGMLDGQPDEFPFIVVSPQASPGGTWWTEDALPILDALRR